MHGIESVCSVCGAVFPSRKELSKHKTGMHYVTNARIVKIRISQRLYKATLVKLILRYSQLQAKINKKSDSIKRELTTLRDLVDGKVVAASKERIVIQKDGKTFELSLDNGSHAIREINKQQ